MGLGTRLFNFRGGNVKASSAGPATTTRNRQLHSHHLAPTESTSAGEWRRNYDTHDQNAPATIIGRTVGLMRLNPSFLQILDHAFRGCGHRTLPAFGGGYLGICLILVGKDNPPRAVDEGS